MTEATMKLDASAKVLGPGARKWLEARGLDSELCERLGLTSRSGAAGGEIVIPYEKGTEIINHKYRNVAEKRFHQDKDGAQIFWRYDAITDLGLVDQPLLITEGEFDAIAAIQAGYWRTVSVPAGAPQKANEGRSGAKYAFLEDARLALEPIREIIIAADRDEPGAALLTDLTALLGLARCKFVSYPDGCKDLNDVLLKHGEDGVRSCVDGARWVRVAGVYKLSELPPLPDLIVWRPSVLPVIDKLIPICPGHISIWTGIAGHGKSLLVNACAWSIAAEHDLKIAHGTFESTPQREYREDFISYYSGHGFNSPDIRDGEIKAAEQWLESHVVFLNSDGYANPNDAELIDATLEWFFDAARTAVVRHGCRIVILDPWSQIDHELLNHEREDQYIRRALKMFKQFARTFDVHVAIIAHPAKPRKDRDGAYEMPGGYEISGAAHWFNFADLGVTVHREPTKIKNADGEWEIDPQSTRVLVRAWKVKFHRTMGKPGEAYADVVSNTGRYVPAKSWE